MLPLILLHHNGLLLRVEGGGDDGAAPDFLLRIVFQRSAFRLRDEQRAVLQFGHADGEAGAARAGDDDEVVVAKDVGGLVVDAVPPVAEHMLHRLDAHAGEARAVVAFHEFQLFRVFDDDVAGSAVGQAAGQPEMAVPGGDGARAVVVFGSGDFFDKLQRFSVVDMDEIL